MNTLPRRHLEARARGHHSRKARAGRDFLADLAGVAALAVLLIAGLWAPYLAGALPEVDAMMVEGGR